MESCRKKLARHRKRKYRTWKKECTDDIAQVLKKMRSNYNEVNADVTGIADQEAITEPSINTAAAAEIDEEPPISTMIADSELPVCDASKGPAEESTGQFNISYDLQASVDKNFRCEDVSSAENLIEEDETNQIREWAISRNIKHVDLDHLLRILRRRLMPHLPKTSKSFLYSSSFTEYEIEKMEDSIDKTSGEFVYFGVENNLQRQINTDIHSDTIQLQINVDGMQVFNSGGKHFWPILGAVHFIPEIYEPFPIAIYSGASKPACVDEYLAKFIVEINHLQKDGITISGKHFMVSLKCFVCDTPARTYLKFTKGHGGYSACERCTCYGTRTPHRKGYTMVYSETDCPRRTDQSFRDLKDPEHHVGISPLLKIDPHLDIVNVFLLDSMHLLGVVKKLLIDFWLGPKSTVKIGSRAREELSRRLLFTKSVVPCEFQRKPRSIYHVHKWKATEYRFFLLYCGPIVLKNLLRSTHLYKHFLLLHAAFRIMCSDELALKKIDSAKLYLKRFVQALPHLYGQAATVINMHNLIHVADDVQNMGCSLSRISCFPFENLLGKMSRMVRTPNLLLSQICRRLQEKHSLQSHKATLPLPLKILNSKIEDGCINATKICVNGSMTITTKNPNNLVLMEDGRVIQISKIVGPHSTVASMRVEGCIWKKRRPAVYTYPCHSKNFQTWELVAKPSTDSTQIYRVSDIKTKLVKILFSLKPGARSSVYVMPLLHV